jgi:serine protease Do
MLACGAAGADAGERTAALSSHEYANGVAVRRAFVDVVDEANQWTVRVLVNDVDAALGVIVRSDGYILTKGSELQGRLTCQLANTEQLPAQYVAYHGEHDLALLKVEASGLPVARWREGGDLQVGRWVASPDQQGPPCAVGVMSVGRRGIPKVHISGVLGVKLEENANSPKVQEVFSESGAEAAHVRPGDLIKQVSGVTVSSVSSLKREIERRAPGDVVTLLIERDGRDQSIQATLTHPFGSFLSRIAMQNAMGGELSLRRSGFPAVLQHDTVLSPEECGGPLVDLSGQVVGINIARAGRTESYAVPGDVVQQAITEMLSGRYPAPQLQLADTPAPRDGTSSVGMSQSGGGE